MYAFFFSFHLPEITEKPENDRKAGESQLSHVSPLHVLTA